MCVGQTEDLVVDMKKTRLVVIELAAILVAFALDLLSPWRALGASPLVPVFGHQGRRPERTPLTRETSPCQTERRR